MKIQIEVSPGELVDRVSILQIKEQYLAGKLKWAEEKGEEWYGVALEQYGPALQVIREEFFSLLHHTVPLKQYALAEGELESFEILYKELREINKQLWDAEDEIRLQLKPESGTCEGIKRVSQSICDLNSKRSETKSKINRSLSSNFDEVKFYAE